MNFVVHLMDFFFVFVFDSKAFRKDNRVQLARKELFKNTLRKTAYAWKKIIELKLSGIPI